MTPLKLQKRDDPLAVGPERAQAGGEPAGAATAVAEASPPAQLPEVAPRPTRSRPARRRPAASAHARAAPDSGSLEAVTYDEDRLEQTGWRIFDSLLEEVRERAQALTEAGVPTSAAALAAATLHSRLPRTVEEGTDVMRVYRQASAGRARPRRNP